MFMFVSVFLSIYVCVCVCVCVCVHGVYVSSSACTWPACKYSKHDSILTLSHLALACDTSLCSISFKYNKQHAKKYIGLMIPVI
jgi:hypothetical protein